jgi:hypothetical protein
MKAVFREDDFSVNPHCNLLWIGKSFGSILSFNILSTMVDKVLATVMPR